MHLSGPKNRPDTSTQLPLCCSESWFLRRAMQSKMGRTFSWQPQEPHTAETCLEQIYLHSLPWNPLPFMSPSVTHQPELLLFQWMLHMLECLIESILQHPLVLDPTPSQQHFTDHNSYRLFVLFRNALHRLAPLMLDLTQGRRLLQFLPGSP